MSIIRESGKYRTIYSPGHHKEMKGDNWEGFVYEHILVAEEFLGRLLLETEEIHHLDENKRNNRHENLLVLTKPQHTKFHEWLKRIKSSGAYKTPEAIEVKICKFCGKTLQDKQKNCCSTECSNIFTRKVIRPTKDQLRKDIKEMSYVAIGKKYGVRDNSIRKWLKL